MIYCVSKYMYTLNIIWVHVTGSDECFNINSVTSQGQATNRLDTNDISNLIHISLCKGFNLYMETIGSIMNRLCVLNA